MHDMRRKDKEITEVAAIEAILKRNNICRLALFDAEYPYIVPLCYGYENGCLYFHGFAGGTKLDLIGKNPNVSFEVEEGLEVTTDPDPCEWSVKYRSVVGRGVAEILEDGPEKRAGLDIVVKAFAGRTLDFPDKAMAAVTVVRVRVKELAGRRSGYTD
jgi:nitroimidazol reductase NimA-like FMN-containing flavoprotein (pyridoxamine 5'-phosphate oxidase superfamily)